MDHDDDMVGKKEEFWRNNQNGDLSGKTFFLKGTSYLFQQTSIFGKTFFKRDFLQKPIYGKEI